MSHHSSLLMCISLTFQPCSRAVQACTCGNQGMCKADDAVLPTMSCGSPPGPSACPALVQEKDQNRVRGMRIMLERQTRAAGAAASADTENAAKAAAEAQLLPQQAAAAALEEAAGEGGAGAAASSSAFAGDQSCASLYSTPKIHLQSNSDGCALLACCTALPEHLKLR